jgi:DNA-binding XRE family transcriptional regulator
MTKKTFSKNLKHLRNKADMTQEELAAAFHITRARLGAWEGGVYYVFKKNKGWAVLSDDDFKEQAEKAHEFDIDLRGHKIEAIWSPEEPACSWLIKTDIPHATFDITEDGELFCRGIVFSIDDL